MRTLALCLVPCLAALALPAAAADFACIQSCTRQGYDQSQCVTMCQSNAGAPGITQQPGVLRNPYFDALPDPVPKSKPLPRIDPRCLDDCTAKGYKYQLCRKQCSY